MYHASGEFTTQRDAMMKALGTRGRLGMRRFRHRVVQGLQPWFSLSELLEGPFWDQSMCWTEQGWQKFLVRTLRQLELTKILEFCLIRDVVSGNHWQEEA